MARKFRRFAYIWGKYRITSYLHGFSGPLGQKWGFWVKIGEGVVRYWPPNKFVFTVGGSYVCANLGDTWSRNATVRDSQTETLTHWLTDANRFYNPIWPMLYAISMGQITNWLFFRASNRLPVKITLAMLRNGTVSWMKQQSVHFTV